MNTRLRYINAFEVINSLELISRYKELVKPSEKTIDNPAGLARLILRRKLKEFFPDFLIRKNQYNYSVRCDNSEIYRALQMHQTFTMQRYVEWLRCFTPELQDHLRETIFQENSFFQMIQHNDPFIKYDFKSDERLFLYFSFNAYADQAHYLPNTYNATVQDYLDKASFLHRVSVIENLSKEMFKLSLLPIHTMVIDFFKERRSFELTELATSSENKLDEDFLVWYFSLDRGSRHGRNLTTLRAMKRELDTPTEKKEEESEEEIIIPSFHGLRLVEVTEEADTRNTPQIRLDLEDENILLENTESEFSTSSPAAPGLSQEEFQRALRRVREERRSEELVAERNFEIETSDFTTHAAEEEAYITNLPPFALTMEHFLYMPEDTEMPVLRVNSVSANDDIDKDKEGLYYTFVAAKINYIVYVDNVPVFCTENMESASAEFKKIFGKEHTDINFCFSDEQLSSFMASERYIKYIDSYENTSETGESITF